MKIDTNLLNSSLKRLINNLEEGLLGIVIKVNSYKEVEDLTTHYSIIIKDSKLFSDKNEIAWSYLKKQYISNLLRNSEGLFIYNNKSFYL